MCSLHSFFKSVVYHFRFIEATQQGAIARIPRLHKQQLLMVDNSLEVTASKTKCVNKP